MLVCCRRPLPGSDLIVPVLSVFLSMYLVQLTFHFFLRKHLTQACSSITFAVSHLFIKYLFSDHKFHCCRPNLPEYLMPELWHRQERIFIHQFSNFYIVKCTFTWLHLLKFLCKYDFPRIYRRKQRSCFLLNHSVYCLPDNFYTIMCTLRATVITSEQPLPTSTSHRIVK